jgi:hypothetical protein
VTSVLFTRLARLLCNLFLCLWLPLFGCAGSNRVDNRNFAVDVFYPTQTEMQLAQQRAQRYWENNSQQFQSTTKYLAVAATNVSGGDIGQDIYPKLIKSETTASYFSQDSQTPVLRATCIVIYDVRTKAFVSNRGYISVDLPPRGSLAGWENFIARYIGWSTS